MGIINDIKHIINNINKSFERYNNAKMKYF